MNIAVIGCGVLGSLHAQIAEHLGLRVVACGDVLKPKAEALAQPYRAFATDNCMDLVKRDDVDIVLVTTPTPAHTAYVVAAAQAGKHVFCEKPFGRTVEQCEQAIAACRKSDVKLFIGHVVRYFEAFETIRAQIAAGAIGKVGFVKTYRGGGFPGGERGWFGDYKQSGGVTLDCIIHDFDWLRYTFGEVDHVFAQNLREKMTRHETAGKMDYALITFRMKNGIIANVVGSWAHPSGFRVKAEVCGDKGIIQYDSAESPIEYQKRAPEGKAGGVTIPASPVAVSPYQLEWEDFLAWIKQGRAPKVTPEDALEAVRMGLAALESAETGKAVKLASGRAR